MPDPEVVKKDITEIVDHSEGWSWEDQHVAQAYHSTTGLATNQEIAVNDIIESGSVLIAAGPADLGKAMSTSGLTIEGGDAVGTGISIVPIGLVETAQISMNKPLSRIFEIGSKLSYLIPGRTVGGITLSRVFFDGPSLLKILYAGEIIEDAATTEKKYAKFASRSEGSMGAQEFSNIGSGNLAMNLASSFFDQPVGLAFLFKDQNSDVVGQTYFEGCRVSTYNLGISANMNVLTESVNIEFIRCRPVNTRATFEITEDTWREEGQLSDWNIRSAYTNNPTTEE